MFGVVLQVNDIFLPPSSELHHVWQFGYTVHTGQQGMFKVDLAQKKYVKAVDLTKHNCVPTTAAFLPLGRISMQSIQLHKWIFLRDTKANLLQMLC